ncbi:MAG: carboxypeptidase-like regulatory domain-containing protein [Chitinophagaceae bacterium]|nr:MAG: carboxypeptidase-like regulatory domain-containing protein [Chitinophagaceae bacterium]
MKVLLALITLFFAQATFAQSDYFILTGKVTLAATGEPLQGASVFAENTTLGTATDDNGNFKLYLPNGGYDVIATFTGYQSESVRVTSSQSSSPINFSMKLKEKELDDVVVVASNEVKDGWERYGGFFINEFIGQTQNSRQCEIKNPEVLKFYYSKRRDRLKVKAEEPLIIENRALGYNIRYSLDSFTHEYATQVSFYSGNPLFEEMKTDSLIQQAFWTRAREEAYKGSLLHFMRSLYNKTLKEEGFEVQFVITTGGVDRAEKLQDYYNSLRFTLNDSTGIATINPFQPNVGVLYMKEKPLPGFNVLNEKEPSDFQFSILSIAKGEPIMIERNGFYFDQTDITISAYYTWEKVGDQLPYDYRERN